MSRTSPEPSRDNIEGLPKTQQVFGPDNRFAISEVNNILSPEAFDEPNERKKESPVVKRENIQLQLGPMLRCPDSYSNNIEGAATTIKVTGKNDNQLELGGMVIRREDIGDDSLFKSIDKGHIAKVTSFAGNRMGVSGEHPLTLEIGGKIVNIQQNFYTRHFNAQSEEIRKQETFTEYIEEFHDTADLQKPVVH